MKKQNTKLVTRYSLLVALFLLLTTHYSLFTAYAAEISAVNVNISDNNIYVTTSVRLDSKTMNDLQEGLSKEFVFYIDIFRRWGIWPNEFVTGKRLTKMLMSNPIRREYTAISIEGNIHTEKRFRSLDSMVEWATNFQDIKLTNIRQLESGTYFVRFTAESRIRRLPPVIELFLFFVPEKEFNVSRNSLPFEINHKGLRQ